jgi:hypothetical protein
VMVVDGEGREGREGREERTNVGRMARIEEMSAIAGWDV